jgi:drug/metabolite transporter (DMT)-like permease
MTALGAFAGLCLKKVSSTNGIFGMLKNIYLYLGAFLYIIAAVLNIIVLKYYNYSLVLPLTSITYIWTMLVSYIFLKEKITKNKIIGVLLICVGAVLLVI